MHVTAVVLLLLLAHIRHIKQGDAAELMEEEDFFSKKDTLFDDNEHFFESPSTSKPFFENDLDDFYSSKEKNIFFTQENDVFDKIKENEDFFFKENEPKDEKGLEPAQTVSQQSRVCNCHDVYCGCCSSVKILGRERFRVCFEMEYVQRDFAMFMTLSINRHVVLTRVLSGRNPLPFCTTTRYVPLVSFCIRLYDIHHNPKGLSLCMRLEATSMRRILFSISFDCIKIDDHKISFYMPPNATTFGVVGFHLGDVDPYISYQDWTKLHFPLPEITTSLPSTASPASRHHFLWFKWK